MADAVGQILNVSAAPACLFTHPLTIQALLKLKDGQGRDRLADLQTAASVMMGVPARITRGVAAGEGFLVYATTLIIIRRQDVQTEVFKQDDFGNALVGIRTMARMQLVSSDIRGTVHITGLPIA